MLLFLGDKEKFFNFLKKKNISFYATKKNINNYSSSFLEKFTHIISFNYRFKLEKKILNKFKNRCFNCHISYLPYNKGSYPNFWSFYNNTKKGVTIHLMDSKIDKGPIIFQKRLFFDKKKETLRSTHKKLNSELESLLIKKYEKLISKNFKQKKNLGCNFHKKKDFDIIKNKINNIYDIKINKLLTNLKNEKNKN